MPSYSTFSLSAHTNCDGVVRPASGSLTRVWKDASAEDHFEVKNALLLAEELGQRITNNRVDRGSIPAIAGRESIAVRIAGHSFRKAQCF